MLDPSKKTLKIDSSLSYGKAKYTQEQIRAMFKPPVTLAGPHDSDLYLAQDSQLADSGYYNLIAHSFALGQMPFVQFAGYGALSAMSTDGMLRNCISAVVRDQLKNWIEFKVKPSDKDGDTDAVLDDFKKEVSDDVIAKIEAFSKNINLKKKIKKAFEIDGYMGGCFIFIDTGVPAEERAIPLDISEKSAELKHGHKLDFKIVEPINCFPGTYNSSDPLADNYLNPDFWWVLGCKVHKSRLIRIVSNEVVDLLKPAFNFLGLPQAQILWDYVIHFNDNRHSSNKLLKKFSTTVMKTKMTDVLNGGVADDLDRRVDYFVQNRNNDSVTVIDKDLEDIVKLETPLSGVDTITRQSLEYVAAINHTPAVVLLGQSPNGFNATGESDLKNYRDLIDGRNEDLLREPLTTIFNLIQIHECGRIDPDIEFSFVPFDKSDENIEAQTNNLKADRYSKLIASGVISPEEARRNLINDKDSGFNDLNADDLPENNVPDYEDDLSENPLMSSLSGTNQSVTPPDVEEP